MSLDVTEILQDLAIKRGLPPALVHALINRLSGGEAFVQKQNARFIKQVDDLSKKIKYQPQQIKDALDTTHGYCTFDFDEQTWKFFAALKSLTFEERLLLSCRLGLTRRLGREYAFSRGLFDQNSDMYGELKKFMEDVNLQIDLLINDMQNLAGPGEEEQTGQLLFMISKIFDRGAQQVLPQARKVLEDARALEPAWQERMKALNERKQAEALRLYHKTEVSNSGERSHTPVQNKNRSNKKSIREIQQPSGSGDDSVQPSVPEN